MVDNTEPASRLPRGKAYTRDYALPPRVPRDQEISNSVIDTIWNKLLYRRRPVAPDSFETFLRDLKEVTLADIYHTLNEKPAASFEGLVWFAVSCQGFFSLIVPWQQRLMEKKTLRTYHSPRFSQMKMSAACQYLKLSINFEPTMSKHPQVNFDYGMLPSRAIESGDLMCSSCLTKTAPVMKRLFSYFRLFTLSAYAEPQFWARTLLAFLSMLERLRKPGICGCHTAKLRWQDKRR